MSVFVGGAEMMIWRMPRIPARMPRIAVASTFTGVWEESVVEVDVSSPRDVLSPLSHWTTFRLSSKKMTEMASASPET